MAQGVAYWAGADSLPLWLPPDHEGFAARSNAAALAQGLTLRPWQETLRDTLDDERSRGLGRERKAGSTPRPSNGWLTRFGPPHPRNRAPAPCRCLDFRHQRGLGVQHGEVDAAGYEADFVGLFV